MPAITGRPRLLSIAAAFLVVWIWLAITPFDREDWAMENTLVFLVIAVLAAGYERFQFSDLSYLLIAVFLTLHEFGAHYSYDRVPLGLWLKNTFHFARNDYDRIVHFSFGFCWTLPLREFFIRRARIRGLWTYYLPVSAVLAWSAVYEIIEAYTAQMYPGEERKFLGLQGDIFDSQRDMTCSLLGAVICTILLALAQAVEERKH